MRDHRLLSHLRSHTNDHCHNDDQKYFHEYENIANIFWCRLVVGDVGEKRNGTTERKPNDEDELREHSLVISAELVEYVVAFIWNALVDLQETFAGNNLFQFLIQPLQTYFVSP